MNLYTTSISGFNCEIYYDLHSARYIIYRDGKQVAAGNAYNRVEAERKIGNYIVRERGTP